VEIVLPLVFIFKGWVYACAPVNEELEIACFPVREVYTQVVL